jgi:hypothetical protein
MFLAFKTIALGTKIPQKTLDFIFQHLLLIKKDMLKECNYYEWRRMMFNCI